MATLILLSAPGTGHAEPAPRSGPPDRTTNERPTYTWNNSASPVVLLQPRRNVSIKAHISCWDGPANDDGIFSTLCVDGPTPRFSDLADAGRRHVVRFWFGMPGWEFRARLWRGGKCLAATKARATGEQTFQLKLTAPRGSYRVELYGVGPEGNEYVHFRWTSTSRTPHPAAGC